MLPFMEFDVRGERYYDGFILENVCGTYLHGLFENGELIDRLGRLYFERRGLSFCEDLKTGDYEDFQEKQYDLLADTVRKNLDMKAIYGAIGLK
ncbi:MAG TPA: cobyric acid synthase CobQ, partial [Lachnospiraceae bacterium]|nr:cobyric acid synthase CobQ [Lachnospiraceae bacterium]